MTCDAHLICWNEIDTIHLTVQHYKKFCDRIFIYDNYSDDGTDTLCEELGCKVQKFGTPGELNDTHYTALKNSFWKGSDADWVFVGDSDEILYHEDLLYVLRQGAMDGATIFKTKGVNMVSDTMPFNDWLNVRTGVEDKSYGKLCIFNPKAITDINYIHGCHVANPAGRLEWGPIPLYLLHYRCVGGFDRLLKRHQLYAPRLSEINIRWNMGNYRWVNDHTLIEAKRAEFAALLESSKTLSQLGIG